MSFWDTDDGESIDTSAKEFDTGGGNIGVIPDGSSVIAMIDEAEWRETRDRDAEFVSLRWSIVAPDEFQNRKVWQKLWVTDVDPNAKDAEAGRKKRDKAKRMLAAIDANAGGKLLKIQSKPTDNDLAASLMNKPMVIRLGVWGMNGNEGNWVQAVSEKSKGIDIKEAKPSSASKAASSLDGDYVPF